MKRSYRKYIGFMMLVVMLVSCINISAKTSRPEIIRVGLESVYKDVSEIKLKSDSGMMMGYLLGTEFIEEEYLDSQIITIKRDYGTYYEIDETFRSLEAASDAAIEYEGIPVYIAPEFYKVYTEDSVYEAARTNPERIAIYDEMNNLLFLAENDETKIEFQGTSYTYDFPVTTVGSRVYRGTVSVVNGERTGLTAVNTVELDSDYLYGVVASEMVPSWPMEALKAQAVAARTMAMYQYNKFQKRGYNVVDTVSSQVYKGVTGEHPRTSQAVDETSGEVITYNGQIIDAVFFSTSGGYTENSEDVWGSPYPYLKAVPDIYETEPEMKPWTRVITLEELQASADRKGLNIGQVEGMKIVSRTAAGRVKQLDILGSKGVHSLTKEEIRTFFSGTKDGSLRSRMFKFEPYDNTNNDIVSKPEILTKEVTVMSSNNIVSSKLKDGYIMSTDNLTPIGDKIVMQSADGIKELELKVEIEGTTPTPEVTDGAVIYGDVTIHGKGYGHGVGMSQSGAKGMAQEGYTYDEILRYYYTDVEIER